MWHYILNLIYVEYFWKSVPTRCFELKVCKWKVIYLKTKLVFNTLKGCRITWVFVQLGYLHFQFCLVMLFDRFLGFGNNLMHVYHFTTLSIVCLLAFLFSTVFYSVVFYDLLAFYRFLCTISCQFKNCMNFSFRNNVNFPFIWIMTISITNAELGPKLYNLCRISV